MTISYPSFHILTLAFILIYFSSFSFFFTATATTEIYTLSLHDALPISGLSAGPGSRTRPVGPSLSLIGQGTTHSRDRKSTRLNSSHITISYAVFCLKKKKKTNEKRTIL